ncbi:hypothetical protein Ahy_A10g047510 [Arachis hypogaea]|uniref:Transposase MuDR plant domain-containing protein n=1 Tax=Arachis hypogaea TaxID=3818 RepID=A0A445B2W6_ARAHY|nr:hypothetical protein Ahy_A10g047510 [Arachis hypogaea]
MIPFTISFEEFKGVICEKIHSERVRRISCIYPIEVFGGFIQFQTKYVTNEASMQEMFSMYIENRSQLPFIELYVEFEQSEADRNILRKDYNGDSEEEFESNYEVIGPDGDEDQGDEPIAPDVSDVANTLANEVPFEESSFMRILDLEAMHVPKFLDYISAEISFIADGEFAVGMEFSSREAVIKAIKEYTIRRSVDYRVYEFEPLTFYAKCTQYGSGCDWLIQVSMISWKYCWVIRRYNGSHTYTRATISQDHSKLDSTTIAEDIRGRCGSTKCITSVSCFDQQNEVFEVREMPSELEFAVDLRGLRCDCGEFQMDQVRRVYRARFKPLDNPTTWPAYNGPRFMPNLFLRRITKGRPRMMRFLNEMDTRMTSLHK